MSDTFVDNPQLALICGLSGTGKSASLRNIRNQENWIYANTESGKRLPFRNKFDPSVITDPYQVTDLLQAMVDNPEAAVEGMIIDTATFLMDMYESRYVLGSANTQKAWGDYQQFWKDLMQQKVAKIKKPVLILAHTREELDEAKGDWKVSVPVKGALRGSGIEAYFSTVVATKKVKLKDLLPYENELLNITEEDEVVGYKHVFQTRPTKETTGERIRSPIGLFTVKQTFIDNDAQLLLDHLNSYYNG